MKKFVLSVEKPDGDIKFVYADSDIRNVQRYIKMKYRGSEKVCLTREDLFKSHVVEKYSYIIKRTYTIQDKFLLRIKVIDLKEDFYYET